MNLKGLIRNQINLNTNFSRRNWTKLSIKHNGFDVSGRGTLHKSASLEYQEAHNVHGFLKLYKRPWENPKQGHVRSKLTWQEKAQRKICRSSTCRRRIWAASNKKWFSSVLNDLLLHQVWKSRSVSDAKFAYFTSQVWRTVTLPHPTASKKVTHWKFEGVKSFPILASNGEHTCRILSSLWTSKAADSWSQMTEGIGGPPVIGHLWLLWFYWF